MDKYIKQSILWLIGGCIVGAIINIYIYANNLDYPVQVIAEPTTKIIEVEKIIYATEKEQMDHDKEEVEMIAKTIWGEARNCSLTEQAAVVWCILNRVDDDRFPDNITDVITQANQFSGYSKNYPIVPQFVELAEDVMTRWMFEETAVGDVGRILPKEYCWFRGDGKQNFFRDSYKGGKTWDWSLTSPYMDDCSSK